MNIDFKNFLAAVAVIACTPVHAANLSLPFNGQWFVAQAGDTPNVNHHMSVRAQWFGVDFAKTGGASGRQLRRGNAKTVEDFYCWGQPVLAPARGQVASLETALADNSLGKKDKENPAGNYVAIKIGNGKFVFLAHLQKDSVTAKLNANVEKGQQIGRCGNSGNSDFPHVHLHVQDTPTLNQGNGQNPIFGPINVELTGEKFSGVTWPVIRGLFVSND